jgi:hypothetical protein
MEFGIRAISRQKHENRPHASQFRFLLIFFDKKRNGRFAQR